MVIKIELKCNMKNQILIDRLKRIELKQKQTRPKESGFRVYYGWAKLNKIRKKEAISVIFENTPGAGEHHRFGKTLSKCQHTVYSREQTDKEAEDAIGATRVFSEYSIFLDDKRINGSLEAALQANSNADKNNVSKEIRDEIEGCLRKFFMEQHPGYKEKTRQLEIGFID